MNCKRGFKLWRGGCVKSCDGYPEDSLERTKYLYDYCPRSQKAVCMAPDAFLGLVAMGPNDLREQKLGSLREHIKQGKKLDPCFLDVDLDTKRVLGHEGRHRAHVAKELGITLIPVIIYHRQEYNGGHKNICNLHEPSELPEIPDYDPETDLKPQ